MKKKSLRPPKQIWDNKWGQLPGSVWSINPRAWAWAWACVAAHQPLSDSTRSRVWRLRLGPGENEESGIRSERAGWALACMSKQLFHVIVKHTMATETSADYQPGNIGPLGALSTHRAQNFQHDFFLHFQKYRAGNERNSSGNTVFCSEPCPTVWVWASWLNSNADWRCSRLTCEAANHI